MNGPGASGGCAPNVELLPELALGILAGAERAEVLAHLDRCASCRDESAAWAATADALPLLLAEAEPPAGFESRTLQRLESERALVPRQPLIRRVLAIAAIAAAVMIATLGAVRIVDAAGSGSPPSRQAAGTEMTSAPMIGKGGHVAGRAFMTVGAERYMFLDVDYGADTGRYRIEMLDQANRVTGLGSVRIAEGHGAWAGELPADSKAPAKVRVVDLDGKVLCSARFGTVAT